MGLLNLLVLLIVIGVVLYLVETYLPMSPPIKTLLRVVVILIVILWLVQALVGDIPLPRLHLR